MCALNVVKGMILFMKNIFKLVKSKVFTVAEDLVKVGKREEYVINGMYLVLPEKADEWVRFVDSALTGSDYFDKYYVMKGDLKSEVILENVLDGLVMIDQGYSFEEIDKTIRMYSQGEELRFIRRCLVNFSLLGKDYLNYLSGNETVKVKVLK